MVMGVAVFIAGLYVASQPQPNTMKSIEAAVESCIFMGAGGLIVMCAKDIVKGIDKAGER